LESSKCRWKLYAHRSNFVVGTRLGVKRFRGAGRGGCSQARWKRGRRGAAPLGRAGPDTVNTGTRATLESHRYRDHRTSTGCFALSARRMQQHISSRNSIIFEIKDSVRLRFGLRMTARRLCRRTAATGSYAGWRPGRPSGSTPGMGRRMAPVNVPLTRLVNDRALKSTFAKFRSRTNISRTNRSGIFLRMGRVWVVIEKRNVRFVSAAPCPLCAMKTARRLRRAWRKRGVLEPSGVMKYGAFDAVWPHDSPPHRTFPEETREMWYSPRSFVGVPEQINTRMEFK